MEVLGCASSIALSSVLNALVSSEMAASVKRNGSMFTVSSYRRFDWRRERDLNPGVSPKAVVEGSRHGVRPDYSVSTSVVAGGSWDADYGARV